MEQRLSLSSAYLATVGTDLPAAIGGAVTLLLVECEAAATMRGGDLDVDSLSITVETIDRFLAERLPHTVKVTISAEAAVS